MYKSAYRVAYELATQRRAGFNRYLPAVLPRTLFVCNARATKFDVVDT